MTAPQAFDRRAQHVGMVASRYQRGEADADVYAMVVEINVGNDATELRAKIFRVGSRQYFCCCMGSIEAGLHR
jgi:hypothetical protein